MWTGSRDSWPVHRRSIRLCDFRLMWRLASTLRLIVVEIIFPISSFVWTSYAQNCAVMIPYNCLSSPRRCEVRLLVVSSLLKFWFRFSVCLAETLSRSSVSQSYLRSKLWIDSFISFFLFIFSGTIDRFVKVQEALVIVFLVETRSMQNVILSTLSASLCVFFLLISLSLSLCFFRSFLRWTVSWFGTSDASGLLNGLWIHISVWRNWIVDNWLHWARPAFALVTSREFPLHVSVLFRWAEHKNPHTGTVESLATSRAQLSAQMIDYRASRAFRRKADSARDEEWERRGCCTLLFPKKRMSEWAGTVRIGTWTKERGRWKKGEKQEASYVKILSAKVAVLQNSMVTWRWMARQRRLVLSLGLSVLFLSLFSSAFVYKFGAALGCDFLKGSFCKNVSPLSSIAAPLPLPQDLHKDLSAQEQFPPPLRHQLPSDLELPRNYSDDELTARVLAQDILSRSTLNIEHPKLAFMFLTPGPLPFEGLWNRFFEVRSPIPKLDCFLLPLQSRFCGWHAQNLNLISVSALYAGPWR